MESKTTKIEQLSSSGPEQGIIILCTHQGDIAQSVKSFLKGISEVFGNHFIGTNFETIRDDSPEQGVRSDVTRTLEKVM